MPRGVASAKQLAMMERVLTGYCRTHDISDPDDRDHIATLILELFNTGQRSEEALTAELERRRPKPAT